MDGYRAGNVFVDNIFAGKISECDDGYSFKYDEEYLKHYDKPVSLTLPLQREAYISDILFPFFDGLIPEGYLLELTINNWKLKPNDRFAILLVATKDPIGNVHIEEAR